jgi:hypothetical protein
MDDDGVSTVLWPRKCYFLYKVRQKYLPVLKVNKKGIVYAIQSFISQSERTIFTIFKLLSDNLKDQCSPLFKNYVVQIHIWRLTLKFRIARLVISGGIAAISCWIAAFSSSVVLGLRL